MGPLCWPVSGAQCVRRVHCWPGSSQASPGSPFPAGLCSATPLLTCAGVLYWLFFPGEETCISPWLVAGLD